jgi:hypothetical protein
MPNLLRTLPWPGKLCLARSCSTSLEAVVDDGCLTEQPSQAVLRTKMRYHMVQLNYIGAPSPTCAHAVHGMGEAHL